MDNRFPLVPLDQVLSERKEKPDPEALLSGDVRIVEKIGFNDGRIHLREEGTTKTSMILIRPGDLVVSGINAAKGAIAIYGKDNTKPAAATIHYGAYAPDREHADIRYLWWLLRSRTFRELLLEHVPGGIKTELKSKRLLPVPVPLPSVSKQRRIVARIEEFAARIEEARGLRRQAVEEADVFASSLHLHSSPPEPIELSELIELDEQKEAIRIGQAYPQVGVRGFGQGLFAKEAVDGSQTTYKTFNRLYEGSLVLSQVKGWEGAIAVCSQELTGRYVSPEYRTFRCISGKLLPEYMAALVATPWFWRQLKNLTRGVGARRERTRPEQFLRMKIPMPSLRRQEQAISLLRGLEEMKYLQAETAAELDALLPSVLDRAFKGEL